MKVSEFIDERLVNRVGTNNVIGIDIGSRTGKAILMSGGNAYVAKVGTGFNMQETANELLEQLFEQSGLSIQDIEYVVGTGYGRVSLEVESVPYQTVSEISCHAMGVHYLDADARTVLDIGGQDSKAIRIDPYTGKVVRFIMNDKCAAGTGRFLEKVAGILEYKTEEIGDAALKSQKELDINSQCVVFAESEIISLRASGEKREDIAAGVHAATANRVYGLLKRVDLEPGLQFSGGVANNVGMKHAVETLTGTTIRPTKLNMIYAGCLGAAIYALRYIKGEHAEEEEFEVQKADISEVLTVIEESKKEFIAKQDDKKRIGYFCSYTPIELLEAAGVRHTRLFKAGNVEELSLGELVTKGTTCDMAKSCIGIFANKDPLYNAVDKIYTFYTCITMKSAAEAINAEYVPTEILNLPRQKKRESNIWMFREEMKNLRNDLGLYVGTVITDDKIIEKIKIYNQIREKIRRISALRKRNDPPIKGQEFLEVIKAFYYVPPEKQLSVLDKLYNQLSAKPDSEKKRMRIMIVGGIEGDGDKRILEIVENELDARVVIEDHCTGYSAINNNIPVDGDPVQTLADSYLNETPCAIMSPIEDRIEESARLAAEYQVDGVIYTYLKFCACYGIPKNMFVSKFREMDIPVLELAMDYSKSDEGQLKTRIGAFIEVLHEVRSERKSEKK